MTTLMLYVGFVLLLMSGAALAVLLYVAHLEDKQSDNETGTDDPRLAEATRRRYNWDADEE